MSDDYFAGILGDKNIHPVTVYEMVDILKPLIDEYRVQAAKSGNITTLMRIRKRVRLYKDLDPKLFALSRRYLRTKRVKLLKAILGSQK